MLLGFDIGGAKCAVILGKLLAVDQMQVIDKVTIPTDRPVDSPPSIETAI